MERRPLQGTVALVTGSGRGIGRAIALALAGEGASVSLCARTEGEIRSVAGEIESRGAKAVAIRADLGREADAGRAVSETLKTFGRLDILVNNAGIGTFASVKDLSAAAFDAMWNVNMRGVFLCTRAALPAMMEQRSGDIVNIASLAGRNAFVKGAGYAATKWALIGFSRCLMLEVREHNIRVITICPGSVDTAFGDHADRSAPRPAAIPKAEDIARVVVGALGMPRNVMVSEIDVRPTNPKG